MKRRPPRIFYSPVYDLPWGAHVFPTGKYRAVCDRLLVEAIIELGELAAPKPATRDELLAGHTAEYLDRLEAMTEDPAQGYYEFEAPCTRGVLDGFYAMAGGTIAACRAAIAWTQGVPAGFAANLGGGFHHAFPGKGEGFCAINDIVVALRLLLREGVITRAAVVDLDVHQGNGTAKAFEAVDAVFTFSMHQENNYPIKQRSDLDIGLPDGADDAFYLEALAGALPKVQAHRPDLVLYVAGADPYRQDQLGGLAMTIEGLAERDRMVFGAFLAQGVPVAATLAGGYAYREPDVVEIHYRMVRQGVEGSAQ